MPTLQTCWRATVFLVCIHINTPSVTIILNTSQNLRTRGKFKVTTAKYTWVTRWAQTIQSKQSSRETWCPIKVPKEVEIILQRLIEYLMMIHIFQKWRNIGMPTLSSTFIFKWYLKANDVAIPKLQEESDIILWCTNRKWHAINMPVPDYHGKWPSCPRGHTWHLVQNVFPEHEKDERWMRNKSQTMSPQRKYQVNWFFCSVVYYGHSFLCLYLCEFTILPFYVWRIAYTCCKFTGIKTRKEVSI